MQPATAFLRNTWRGLTSMRTALVLLFLLALAALPGALLPQYQLNADRVAQYYAEHPTLAPVLDTLGFFNVFTSPWFAAIYLLLFVSLVGCIVPRSVDYARALRGAPVRTPRKLARLPHHAAATVPGPPAEAVSAARQRLRGWRITERAEPNAALTLSAEKGYVREAGNLVFHVALLGLLVAFAVGQMFGYQGQMIVLADGSRFCNTGPLAYDSFEPGLARDGTGMDPFCLRVNDFHASYHPTGQPAGFRADLDYLADPTSPSAAWQPYTLRVNEPLRLDAARVYLLAHGFAPEFTVTFPSGKQRTEVVQWRTVGPGSLAEGATKFSPPDATSPSQLRGHQLAITGVLAPTGVMRGGRLVSLFPAPRAPAVAVEVYKGTLGTLSGRAVSIFDIDQTMVASGALRRVARQTLRPGQSLTLDDGTVVRFTGIRPWVGLQVSHDPTQLWVLAFALLVLGGLVLSLTIKRRRFWVRATPVSGSGPGGSTVVELGGLARTDAAGYQEEFDRLARELLPADEPGQVERTGTAPPVATTRRDGG